MATLEHDGTTLSYDDNGAVGAPAFVFVHGWCCNRSFFAPQYEHFGRDHRAISVDLRGHGESGAAKDGDYSIEAFARDIAALIEALDLAPAVVVGHSLGGVITTQLAASRPELVAAAVLVDVAPMVISAELRPLFDGLLDAMNSDGHAAARASLVEGMFLPTDDAERKAWISDAMASVPREVATPAIAGILAIGDGPLAAVTCPILSIGSAAPTHEPAQLKGANPKIAIGQTVGSGHFNQLEVPDQINAMIEQFLRINAPL
jgi:pimeloyl-ACP methyl ester carboxylesterase